MDESYLRRIEFKTYTEAEKKLLCVTNITKPASIDELGLATISGLSDPSLGSSDPSEVCLTCSLNGYDCPGHLGSIRFILPLYNPIFFSNLINILKGSCFICHKTYVEESILRKFTIRIKLIRMGLLSESNECEFIYSKKKNSLIEQRFFKKEQSAILIRKLNKFYKKVKNFKNVRNYELTRNEMDAIHDLVRKFIREEYLDFSVRNCYYCNFPRACVKHEAHAAISIKLLNSNEKFFENVDNVILEDSSIKITAQTIKNHHHLSPSDVLNHFTKLYKNFPSFFSELIGTNKNEDIIHFFFIESICVTPPKFRPVIMLDDGSKFDNAITGAYRVVLSKELLLEQVLAQLKMDIDLNKPISQHLKKNDMRILKKNNKFENIQIIWTQLQGAVNSLYDNKLWKNESNCAIGLKQVLEKKEGLFRMHMMGKRVNYAARSVISPDPMLDIDEVGIPLVFATKLTYPESVTSFNCQALMKHVKNGPIDHPGSTHVEIDKIKIILNPQNRNRNVNTAKRILSSFDSSNILVRRHLMSNDVVLMNRQPTLHRPSIMGHRVRTLPKDRTIRMHYANCKSYNADFDGDEMNCHLPQNELAKSEAFYISACQFQYLSPKDGKPLTGLIQDFMVAGVILSMRDRFITLHQYQNIISAALGQTDRIIETLLPAIIKPNMLWTGKQVISTIIINSTPPKSPKINMNGKSKIIEKLWKNCSPTVDSNLSEDIVIIRDGQLLKGIFDKNQFGATPYGLIHIFHEVYGGKYATKLLSTIGRACLATLQFTGFSVGIEDLPSKSTSNINRKNILLRSRDEKIIEQDISSLFEKNTFKREYRRAILKQNDSLLVNIDNTAKNIATKIQNDVNSACGSEYLVKPFPHNSLHMMILSGSKGTPVNAMQISGLLGQIELEGRRPPLMISGRSLPCYEPYSFSLRAGGFVESSFIDGLKPSEYFFHCMAGREGLVDTAIKTSRSGYLQRCLVKHLEGITVAYDHTARDSDGSIIQFLYGEDGCDVCSLQFAEDKKFEIFSMNSAHVSKKLDPELSSKHIDCYTVLNNIKTIPEALNKTKDSSLKFFPNLSIYNPSHYLGSVSDKYYKELQDFTIREEGKSIVYSKYSCLNWQSNSDDFKTLMLLKYIRSLVEPGECVGVIAAQSVGEPSTQMTLNTFHFAGRGESNVTLGIPRLRELFIVGGDNIKTPTITVQVLPSDTAYIEASKICAALNPIPLSKLLVSIDMMMKPEIINNKKNFRQICQLELHFITKDKLKSFGLTKKKLAIFLKNVFVKKLSIEFAKKLYSSAEKLKVIQEENNREMENPNKSDDELSSDSEFSASETPKTQLDEIMSQGLEKNSDDPLNKKFLFRKENKCVFELPINVTSRRIPLLPIIKNLVNCTSVNQTKGTKRCIFSDAQDVKKVIIEGDNVTDLFRFSRIFDINTVYCNNINQMAQVFGIEAARFTLMKEIRTVFEMYGITINARHITLITDYMTFHGVYKPCNRHGITPNTSPFQKMSFEITTNFLKNSCVLGESETLQSPSARIVTGLPLNGGTGSFDILLSH